MAASSVRAVSEANIIARATISYGCGMVLRKTAAEPMYRPIVS